MSADRQFKTPLFDAMLSLAESRNLSFHTPGHKSGKGISTRFRKFVGPNIFSIDLTTLDEVDSLQKPRGVIKEAQELAAEAYGSEASFFLLNGTSGGNHAMILAACQPGELVLVARNVHQSVVTGLILSGARPVYFLPEVNPDLKLVMNVSFRTTKATIDENPLAKTLILSSPNYYGITADLQRIIPYAHDKGLVVLVDEAHGPHLHFHPQLPCAAMDAGADCVVQSTHKIIGGMTQASMLHKRGEKINIKLLTSVLRQMQTTSPSYILMASLDLARMQMGTEGEKLLDKAIYLSVEARRQINAIPNLSCFGKENLFGTDSEELFFGLDVTKLTISVEHLGLSGFEVSQILNKDYQIQVEMADPLHLLVIVSIGDRQDDLSRLIKALQSISKKKKKDATGKIFSSEMWVPPGSEGSGLTPREAFFKPKDYCSLEASEGKLSANMVTIYPPGIPVLIPGETITPKIVRYLKNCSKLGAIVDGLDESSKLGIVKV